MLGAFVKVLGLRSNGKEVPQELLYNWLALSGIDIFNKDRGYGEFGSQDFMKHWGWDGTRWLNDALKVPQKDKNGQIILDENGNPIMYSLSGEQARQAYLSNQSLIKALMGKTSAMLWPLLTPLANHKSFGYMSPVAHKYKDGDEQEYNGKIWTFKNGKWHHPSNKQSMSAEAMERALLGVDNDFTGGNGLGSDLDPSQYQNIYKNTNAAPKQVIVKIENLMNVESVDLSNPDNAAVIADLKGQLTQALVDVVHDFDETYHG